MEQSRMGLKNTIRHKIVNGKRKPLCDYEGTCMNLAYREVYPDLGKKNKTSRWSYLCRKHFKQEKKRIGKKLIYCTIN